MRDWFDTFGETPLSYEWSPRTAELLGLPIARTDEWMRRYPRWPSTTTVCKHFETWASAVRAADLPPARRIAPGRGLAERVAATRRLSAAGHGPSEIAVLLEISPRTVRGYLRAGSCRGCGTAVVTADRCHRCAVRQATRPHWTRDQALAALRHWAREEGCAPTSHDWTPTADGGSKWAREYPRWPSYVTVKTLFGSWSGGLGEAGLRARGRRWSAGSIEAALREFVSAHERAPTRADLERNPELPSPPTVRAHLGSLQAALEAANLTVRRRGWDRDLILTAMVRYAEQHERLPTSRDWNRSTSAHPHASTVVRRFGSWSAAVAAASARRVAPTAREP